MNNFAQFINMQAPCPCCMPSVVIVMLFGSFMLFQLMSGVTHAFYPKEGGTMRKVLNACTWITSLLIALVAIALGVLSTNLPLRQSFFSKLCVGLAKSDKLDVVRCDLLGNLHGNILELGPGPGTNFRCWSNNTNIESWVGVEPNSYFENALSAEKEARDISFPTKTVWMAGEDLDITPESFDAVVGTHVLCSTKDVDAVLKQVRRALKPGGTYYFIEHVSHQDEHSWTRFGQKVLDPVLDIMAAGCQFKPLWNQLSETANLQGFDVNLVHIKAPIGIPMLVPHIKGTATKRI